MPGNVGVLHTSESDAGSINGVVATLRANNSWSNTVFDPATNQEYVHSNSSTADRSLRNVSGGVETNNRPGCWQIELVGRAKDVPHYDDDWYHNLEQYLRRKGTDWNIPYEFPFPFYGNGAYGLNGIARITNAQWLQVAGWVGHQHVPENLHWDPGALQVFRLHATPGNGVIMPSVPNEVQQILKDAGFYAGAIDGVYGPKTSSAMHAMKNAWRNQKIVIEQLTQDKDALQQTVARLGKAGGTNDPKAAVVRAALIEWLGL